MRGTIQRLSSGSRTGSILAENGCAIPFSTSSIWEYDLPSLAVGQPVCFELASGIFPSAINVRVERGQETVLTAEERRAPVQLRYLGFDQVQNIRTYKYVRVSPREAYSTVTVSVDLGLLFKHHVAIQDGPAACLYTLTKTPGHSAEPSCDSHVLTDPDVLSYLDSRRVHIGKPGRKHPRNPGAGLVSPAGADAAFRNG